MNNPLRYAGTTFYQADFDKQTEQTTVLQVVKNPGWMTPYVACMLVVTGMLAHFGIVLVALPPPSRSSRRHGERASARGRRARRANPGPSRTSGSPRSSSLLFAGYVASKARMPHIAAERNANLRVRQTAARLPRPRQALRHAGPQHAANPLRPAGSDRQRQAAGNKLIARQDPAIVWLLDIDLRRRSRRRPPRLPHRESRTARHARSRAARRLVALFAQRDSRHSSTNLQKQIKLAAAQPEDAAIAAIRTRCSSWPSKLSRYATLVKSFRSPPISTDRDELRASLQQVQADIQQSATRRRRRRPCRRRRRPATGRR